MFYSVYALHHPCLFCMLLTSLFSNTMHGPLKQGCWFCFVFSVVGGVVLTEHGFAVLVSFDDHLTNEFIHFGNLGILAIAYEMLFSNNKSLKDHKILWGQYTVQKLSFLQLLLGITPLLEMKLSRDKNILQYCNLNHCEICIL